MLFSRLATRKFFVLLYGWWWKWHFFKPTVTVPFLFALYSFDIFQLKTEEPEKKCVLPFFTGKDQTAWVNKNLAILWGRITVDATMESRRYFSTPRQSLCPGFFNNWSTVEDHLCDDWALYEMMKKCIFKLLSW